MNHLLLGFLGAVAWNLHGNKMLEDIFLVCYNNCMTMCVQVWFEVLNGTCDNFARLFSDVVVFSVCQLNESFKGSIQMGVIICSRIEQDDDESHWNKLRYLSVLHVILYLIGIWDRIDTADIQCWDIRILQICQKENTYIFLTYFAHCTFSKMGIYQYFDTTHVQVQL